MELAIAATLAMTVSSSLQANAAIEYDPHIVSIDSLDNYKPCKQLDLSFNLSEHWSSMVHDRLNHIIDNSTDSSQVANAAQALEWFSDGSGY